jgi:hypothetical protein
MLDLGDQEEQLGLVWGVRVRYASHITVVNTDPPTGRGNLPGRDCRGALYLVRPLGRIPRLTGSPRAVRVACV